MTDGLDEGKKGGMPPIPAMVMLIVLGAVALRFGAIKSSRPTSDPLPTIQPTQENWVRARLWQDPLEAVYREIRKRDEKAVAKPTKQTKQVEAAPVQPSEVESTEPPDAVERGVRLRDKRALADADQKSEGDLLPTLPSPTNLFLPPERQKAIARQASDIAQRVTGSAQWAADKANAAADWLEPDDSDSSHVLLRRALDLTAPRLSVASVWLSEREARHQTDGERVQTQLKQYLTAIIQNRYEAILKTTWKGVLQISLHPDEPAFTKALVLPVLLSGKPYLDDSENRIRTRFAVLSALARAHYAPKTPTRIHWLCVHPKQASSVQVCENSPEPACRCPGDLVVPLEEMFHSLAHGDEGGHQYSHVFVAWIDEEKLFDPARTMHAVEAGHPRQIDQIAETVAGIKSQLGRKVTDDAARVLRHDAVARRNVASDLLTQLETAPEFDPDGGSLPSFWEEGLKESLQHDVERQLPQETAWIKEQIESAFVPAIAIGPTDSGIFWRLKQEIEVLQRRQPGDAALTPDDPLTVYCPWATASERMLNEFDSRRRHGTPDEQGTALAMHEPFRLVRTNLDDDALAEALLAELILRDVDVNVPSDSIALIAEWDTLYGRAWDATFRHAMWKTKYKSCTRKCLDEATESCVRECTDKSTPESYIRECVDEATESCARTCADVSTENVHSYTYVKGLDGRLPESDVGENGAVAPQLSDDNKTQVRSGEVPVGNNQFDYLRRLEARLKRAEQEKSQRLKAIGIVGSDVYDKLVLLQALRPSFPGAIFFTTDLDARLSHRAQYDYTRNLIVASSFGLQLGEDVQGDIAPFRGSYQTAIYLTTLLAVEDEDTLAALNICPATDGDDTRDLAGEIGDAFEELSPRIYEIARSGPFDLGTHGERANDCIHGTSDLQRRRGQFFWLEFLLGGCVIVLVVLLSGPFLKALTTDETGWMPFALIRTLAYLVTNMGNGTRSLPRFAGRPLRRFALRPLRRFALRPRRPYLNLIKRLRGFARQPLGRIALPLIGLLTVGVLTVQSWIFYLHGGLPLPVPLLLEPITLFEGISVWPTEALRVLAIIVALWFLTRAMAQWHLNEQRLDAPSKCCATGRGEVSVPAATTVGWRGEKSSSVKDPVGQRWLWVKWYPMPIDPGGQESGCDSKGACDLPDRSVRWVWERYREFGRLRHRLARSACFTLLHSVMGICLMNLLGWPSRPFRGAPTGVIDIICLAVSVGCFVFLTYFVLDAARLANGFFRDLSNKDVFWDWGGHEECVAQYGCNENTRGSLDKLRLTANHSQAVGSWVLYPLIVLLLMVVSRNGIFDNWDWPISLVLIIAVAGIAVLGSSTLLRSSARRARAVALNTINAERDFLLSLPLEKRPEDPTIEYLDHAVREINRIRTGAFSPMSENPVLKAVLIPTGGLGLMELIILLSRGNTLPGM